MSQRLLILVQPWEELLRKIRVCQLVSLHLYGDVVGAFPITVHNVEAGKFSIYEWIARDLLKLSHNQKDLTSLEIACITSTKSFFPSSIEGDMMSRRRAVQNSCKPKLSLEQTNDDDHSRTLLFYLNHFGNFRKLATHKSLLLSRQWGKNVSVFFSYCSYYSMLVILTITLQCK